MQNVPFRLRQPTPEEVRAYREAGQPVPPFILVIHPEALEALGGGATLSPGAAAAEPAPRLEDAHSRRRRWELETYGATVSPCKIAAVRRARKDGEPFIPYKHYRRLQRVMVAKEALASDFDVVYDRVLNVFRGLGRSAEVVEEDETHVHFQRGR